MKDSFKEFLGTEKPKAYFQELMHKINEQAKNHRIFPPVDNWFEAFNYFEIEETKLIIIGQDPYYLENQADGLAFSTNDSRCPKSLANIITEIKVDYPESVIETFSLKSWAKQGVLLLNSSLTVNQNEPNSHKDFGWRTFINNLLELITKKNKTVIFGVWGSFALSIVKMLLEKNLITEKQIIYTSHPSPLSYMQTKNSFKNSHFFKRVNLLLEKPIDFSLRKD